MRKIIYIFTYVVALVIGVLLLIFNYEMFQSTTKIVRGVMIATGIIFIIPGITRLFASMFTRHDKMGNEIKAPWYTTTVALLALIWGILIICMPTGVFGNFNITLGISLLIAGIAQIVWMAKESQTTVQRLIIPVLTMTAGVIDFTLLDNNPDAGHSAQYATILSGIMIVIWAINGFYSLRSKQIVAAEKSAVKEEKKAEKAERKIEKTEESREKSKPTEEKPEEPKPAEEKSEESKPTEEKTDNPTLEEEKNKETNSAE